MITPFLLAEDGMPKLYEYFGLIIMFYANEHHPIHVHGKAQGREARAEITIVGGVVSGIEFREVTGRPFLEPQEMRYFEEVVRARAKDIVSKWIDFFVLHKSVRPVTINRRLK